MDFRHFRTILIVLICLAVIVAIIGASPLSDYLTLRNANPTMIQLAQDAGMTRKGELVFLRTNPQFVSDAEMGQDCHSLPANSNGFIEQGCFIPNLGDPSTGRIFLREMPSSLYNLEVTTAAYEMLHPIYASITAQSSSAASSLNSSIENNYISLDDSEVTQLVNLFSKIEPGAKDDELFSILGTQKYDNISSSLQSYYAPYLTDPSIEVNDNQQVKDLFKSDEDQLNQLQSTITTDDSNAKNAYADSVSWANVGNQYEDDRNYHIYSQDIDAENNAINQYDSLLQTYNLLVAQFNGQPLSEIPSKTQ